MVISACNFRQLCFFWSLESPDKSKLILVVPVIPVVSLAVTLAVVCSDIYNSCFLVSVQSFKGCCAITLGVLMR